VESKQTTSIGAHIAGNLDHVESHLGLAIGAFQSASGMDFVDYIRPTNVDPQHNGNECEAVKQGLSELMNADEFVIKAMEQVSELPESHPGYTEISASIGALDKQFRTLLQEIRRRPEAKMVLSELKRVRRTIPNKLVRRYCG